MLKESNISKIIRNTLWLFSEKFLKIFLGFTVSIWVAKYLGPNDFGELSFVITMFSLVQVFLKCGLDNILVRELALSKINSRLIINNAISIRMLFGIVICAGAFTYAIMSDQKILLVFIILSPIFITQAFDVIDLDLQSKSKSKITVRIKYFIYIIINILKVVAIKLNFPLNSFIILFMMESCLVSVVLLFWSLKHGYNFKFSLDKDIIVPMLSESWPYIVSGISVLLYMRVDQVFIKSYLDSKSLGIYSVVMPLSSFWQFIPVTVVTSIAPYVAKNKLKNERLYEKSLYNTFRIFNIFSLSLCVGTWFISDWLMNFLYGKQYYGSGEILKIHIWTNVFICIGMAQSLWVLNEKKPIINIYKTISGALISILLNYYCIQKYGLVSVAYVAVFSQMVATIISDIFFAPKMAYYQLLSFTFLPFDKLKKI